MNTGFDYCPVCQAPLTKYTQYKRYGSVHWQKEWEYECCCKYTQDCASAYRKVVDECPKAHLTAVQLRQEVNNLREQLGQGVEANG